MAESNQNATSGCFIVVAALLACGACTTLMDACGSPEGSPGDATGTTQTAGTWNAGDTGTPPPEPDSAQTARLDALAALVESGSYAQAQDEARALAASPEFAQWRDSLETVADRAEEEAMYLRAQRLSGRDLEGNRDAYRELAERFPQSPHIVVYVQKRDDYAQRVIDRESRRYRRATAPRAAAPSRGCCKRCSAGQPCGDSCISRSKQCHRPPGCAC